MIDWASFNLVYHGPDLNSGYVMSVRPDGEIEYTVEKRLKVEGSFSENVVVRAFAGRMYVSGNPTKFLQGHNLFGSWDLHKLCSLTVIKLFDILGVSCPSSLMALHDLDYKITRIDLTEMYSLGSRSAVKAWMFSARGYLSSNHQKISCEDDETLYIGKHSRRISVKIYYKGDEFRKHPASFRSKDIKDSLKHWANDKLRIEFTLRGKWLEENLFNGEHFVKIQPKAKNAIDFLKHYQNKYRALNFARNLDIDTLKGLYMSLFSKKIRLPESAVAPRMILDSVPSAARGTYLMWQQGFNVKDQLSKPTFYRHRKILSDQLSIDIGRSCPGISSNVIPLIRPITAEPASIPSWAYDYDLVV